LPKESKIDGIKFDNFPKFYHSHGCCGCSSLFLAKFSIFETMERPKYVQQRKTPFVAALNPMWIKITKLAQTDQIGLKYSILVGGLEHELYDFPFSWECHHPN
jgi:hypothetical protein